MSAQADIFTEREGWRGPLGWSLALHGCLFASIVVYGVVRGLGGGSWGSGGTGGGAMSATLVSAVGHPASAQRNGQEHRGPRVARTFEVTSEAGRKSS